jgi:nitrite reductase (NO-forming)
VVVDLETVEEVGRLADGIEYNFWSFAGTVPGPLVRVRAGDIVQINLANRAGNSAPHNIDLHAVNGPGGGAGVTTVNPGERASFEFKALAPGLYVYHCAVAPVAAHISNGMYGMILVEPEEGLPPPSTKSSTSSRASSTLPARVVPPGGVASTWRNCSTSDLNSSPSMAPPMP